jgi:hypothetical protein
MADSTDGRETGINFISSLDLNKKEVKSETQELFDYLLRSQDSFLGITENPDGSIDY